MAKIINIPDNQQPGDQYTAAYTNEIKEVVNANDDFTTPPLSGSGKNLFDKSAAIDGKYINSSGNISSNANYCISDYIPVDEGRWVAFSNVRWTNPFAMVVYAEDKITKIGVFQRVNYENLQIPVGGVYLVTSQLISNKDVVQIEYNVEATVYEDYEQKVNSDFVEDRISIRQRIVLPDKVYFAINKDLSFYNENIIINKIQGDKNEGIRMLKMTRYDNQHVNEFTSANNFFMFRFLYIKSILTDAANQYYQTIDPAINNGKSTNILFIGDSFTDIGEYISELKTLMTNDSVSLNLIGLMGTADKKSENQTGGSMADSILESGRPARIVDVTGITEEPATTYIRTVYEDINGQRWGYKGGKLSGGIGSMRFERNADTVGIDLPATGTLTRVVGTVGDATINYTNPQDSFNNAFWNPTTDELDFNYYINEWGFSDPDIVSVQFTFNDLDPKDTDAEILQVVDNAKQIIDKIHIQYPNAKVAFSIEPSGAYYNRSQDINGRLRVHLRFAELMINQFERNDSYNTFVFIVPSYACVDRVNGYGVINTVPNDRYPSITEPVAVDDVHPQEVGMSQISDCYYPILHKILTL